MRGLVTPIKGPAPRPCESCPYRRDVPSGVWAANEYEKLPEYDKPTGEQPFGLFQCHQSDRDSTQARLCAGWVACHGVELLALRIGASTGSVDPSVFEYTTDVPIFGSGTEAAEHGMAEIVEPGEDAQVLVAKIANNRDDIRLCGNC
jgi:hypothetical protein